MSDDELYLFKRPGSENYQVFGTINGIRVRKSTGTADYGEAKRILDDLQQKHDVGDEYDDISKSWGDVTAFMFDRAKHSARKRGLQFDLRSIDIYRLMKASGFRCSLSGIPLSKRMASDGRRDPWAPSLDRIENRHGYILENVRVVCLAANLAMNEWGQDTLIRLAKGILRNANQVVSEIEKVSQKVVAAQQQISNINSLDGGAHPI